VRRLRVVRVYKAVKSSGGVHTRLRELLPRLSEHVELRVLCYRERGDRADELEAAGIPVDLIPTGIKWAPWNVGHYTAYFRAQRPDIVHTHEYTANTLVVVAAARAGVPVRLRHLHSLAPWGWGGRVRTALRLAADVRAARRASLTLAVSEAVRRLYLARTGLPPEACRVLYNGFDLSRFATCRDQGARFREGLGIPEDAPVAGIVGRLARGKGHRDFLEAAQQLGTRDARTRYLVVGEGGLRSELEERARGLGLAGRVVFTGHRDDIPAALSAMDVFLFPGRPEDGGWVQDGLPGVVIEALAAGTPVVAYDLPMMAEILGAGPCGRRVPVGDVSALVEASNPYLLDRAHWEQTSLAARAQARRFSLDACVAGTVSLYRELLERPRA